jgi:hypothetical protein
MLTPCKFYINGRLVKRTRVNLDAMARDWGIAGLWPLTAPGESDPNNAHLIERHAGGLRVQTTKGTWLEWCVDSDQLWRIEP